MKKLANNLLIFGSLQTVAMAIYHFMIPIQFNWSNYLLETSPTINWALYSIHNYFCFNLLIVSSFLLFFLVKRKESTQTIKTLSQIIVLFWIFSFIYQIIDPMPLPERLSFLTILLPGMALINAIVFIIPLKLSFKGKTLSVIDN